MTSEVMVSWHLVQATDFYGFGYIWINIPISFFFYTNCIIIEIIYFSRIKKIRFSCKVCLVIREIFWLLCFQIWSDLLFNSLPQYLQLGNPKSQNNQMTEWQKIPPNPIGWNAQTLPQMLKYEMAENSSKSLKTKL